MAERLKHDYESARGAAGHRREAYFQGFCADIVRESIDEATLLRSWARIQNAKEVRADPALANMLQGFVNQKKVEIHEQFREHTRRQNFQPPAAAPTDPVAPGNAAPPASGPAPSQVPRPSRQQLRLAFERDRADFDAALHHFDAPNAGRALTRLRGLVDRYGADPGDPALLERGRHDVERLHARLAHFGAHVQRLADHAIAAARTGHYEVVRRFLQRLSSIHAARPQLLSAERFQEIRNAIAHASDEEEHREIARRLIERERAVAAELRRIMATIHEFHLIARAPHDEETFRRAEAQYQAAVREIKSHDNEWMAGLILELEGLIDDLHDPTGRATERLDRFLHSVRHALREIVREIREIRQEQAHPPPPPKRDSHSA